MYRWSRLLAGVALGAAVVAAVPIAAGASGGGATSVRTVSPVDASGQLKAGYQVVRRLRHATCQAGSYMTGVADRCATPAAGAVVLDPCWPTAAPDTFICQAKPWDRKVVQLHVPQPVSGGAGAHHQGLPWGMRLGATVRCLLDPGSVRRLYGHALLYHCSRHRDVFGPLHRSGQHWTAHVYRTGAHTPTGYRSLGWQSVRIAWYGAPITPPASPSPSPTPILGQSSTPTESPTETGTPTATPTG
jgi:hypothetical protein